LHAGPHALWRAAAARARRRCLSAGEIKQVRPLGLVKPKRARERLKDGLGDTGGIAALELRVVGDADAGEQRDLFSPQARNAARAVAVGL
jgi:hypothetical protein